MRISDNISSMSEKRPYSAPILSQLGPTETIAMLEKLAANTRPQSVKMVQAAEDKKDTTAGEDSNLLEVEPWSRLGEKRKMQELQATLVRLSTEWLQRMVVPPPHPRKQG